jgi:virginiamycin B lyase
VALSYRVQTLKVAALLAIGLSTLGESWATDTLSQSPTELAIQAKIPRGGFDLGFGFDSLWMMSDGRLSRVDVLDSTVTDIEIPGAEAAAGLPDITRYRGIAVGEGAVWITDLGNSAIYKVNPQTNTLAMTIPTDVFGSGGSIGVGEGAVWVITFDNHDKTLTRYNAQSGAVEARITLPQPGKGVIVGYGAVWVTSAKQPEIYRIDPRENRIVATIATHDISSIIGAGEDAIWIAFEKDGVAQRIDARTGEVAATIATGASDMESDGDISIGGGRVWIITRSSLIARIDPKTNALAGTFLAESGTVVGRRIRYAAGSLWISGNSIFKVKAPE